MSASNLNINQVQRSAGTIQFTLTHLQILEGVLVTVTRSILLNEGHFIKSSLDSVDLGGPRCGVTLLEEALRVYVTGLLPSARRAR